MKAGLTASGKVASVLQGHDIPAFVGLPNASKLGCEEKSPNSHVMKSPFPWVHLLCFGV